MIIALLTADLILAFLAGLTLGWMIYEPKRWNVFKLFDNDELIETKMVRGPITFQVWLKDGETDNVIGQKIVKYMESKPIE